MKTANAVKSRGFSLIEAAIVMGIAGLLVGAIWMVSVSINESAKASSLIQQTSIFVQNIRNYYVSRLLPTGSADELSTTVYTRTLAAANVWPTDMCNSTCVSTAATGGSISLKNAYQGTTTVRIKSAAVPNVYMLAYGGLPKNGCTQFVSNLSTRAAELGISAMTVNVTAISQAAMPILPGASLAACTSATSNSVTVEFSITR